MSRRNPSSFADALTEQLYAQNFKREKLKHKREDLVLVAQEVEGRRKSTGSGRQARNVPS